MFLRHSAFNLRVRFRHLRPSSKRNLSSQPLWHDLTQTFEEISKLTSSARITGTSMLEETFRNILNHSLEDIEYDDGIVGHSHGVSNSLSSHDPTPVSCSHLNSVEYSGTDKDSFGAAVRLSLGNFRGEHMLSVGASAIRNAAVESFGCTLEDVKDSELKFSDLADGIVELHYFSTSYEEQRGIDSSRERLSILDIASVTRKLASTSGLNSNATKEALIADILSKCSSESEVRFFVRTLQGINKLRIGIGESSIVGAAARSVLCEGQDVDRAEQREAERIGRQMFMARYDPDSFGSTLLSVRQCRRQHGSIKAIELCKKLTIPQLMTPLRAMLASPGASVSEAVGAFYGHRKHATYDGKETVVGNVGDVVCQYKYDGERGLIHISNDPFATNSKRLRVRVFSRTGEDTTHIYGGVAERVADDIVQGSKDSDENFTSCILDGEIVPMEKGSGKLLPFQALRRRWAPPSKKTQPADNAASESDASLEKHKVFDDDHSFTTFIAFDLLELNGISLVHSSLRERRELISKLLAKSKPGVLDVCEDVLVQSGNDRDLVVVEKAMESAISKGCEGLVVKPLDGEKSLYYCGERTRNWLKLKKDYILPSQGMLLASKSSRTGALDTLDLVPLAAYYGKGKRRGAFGSFLMGCRTSEASHTFKTICKVGTGFSDDMLREVSHDLEHHIIDPRTSSHLSETNLQNIRPVPDVFFEPRFVWEVRAADISLSRVHTAGNDIIGRGLGLRFPRFLRKRPDKTPIEATSEEALVELYSRQGTTLDLEQSENKIEVTD